MNYTYFEKNDDKLRITYSQYSSFIYRWIETEKYHTRNYINNECFIEIQRYHMPKSYGSVSQVLYAIIPHLSIYNFKKGTNNTRAVILNNIQSNYIPLI